MEDSRPSLSVVMDRLHKFIGADNVCDLLDGEEISKVGRSVIEGFRIDERSRDEWEKVARKSMDIALQVRQPKNYPFAGASNVKWPLITVAALQFNARAYPAIVEGDDIVKAKVVGSDDGKPVIDPQTGQQAADPNTGADLWEIEPGSKRQRADRISEHMSYQLMEEMEEWEGDTDTLLIQLPIVGCAFRKVYFDPVLDRNKSELVPGIDLIVNQATQNLNDAPRVTHRFERDPNQVEERMRSGIWSDIDLGKPASAESDDMAPYEFIEQHCWLDLDGDGYREPYIVTMHVETEQVVRIYANYSADNVKLNPKETRVMRISKRDYFVKYEFIPDPKGGFYSIGFGMLLESMGAAIDTTINQMLDAGHLQNAGGGFIGSGLRLKKSLLRMEPGVYHTVDAAGPKISEAIYNMEHPGPSAVLFQLLGLMIEAAKDITATKDILTGQTSENQTATTTLALIEQGTKVFTAIFKRVYRGLKQEFKLLYRLNAEHLPEEAYFNVLDTPKAIARSDYLDGDYDICPQADPKNVTDMQRMARAEALLGMVEQPGINIREVQERYLRAIGAEDIDRLFLPPQEPDPLVVADAEATVRGKVARAGLDEAKTIEVLGKEEQRQIGNEVAAVDALEAPSKDMMDREERAEERQMRSRPAQ